MLEKLYKYMELTKRFVPNWVRAYIRKRVSLQDYDMYRRRSYDSLSEEPLVFNSPSSPCMIGIIRELFNYHKNYVRACRELGISYRIIDITGSDWLSVITKSDCAAFLVWPTTIPVTYKELFDDRTRIMVEELGKTIYPSLKELWLYESKLRTRDWLDASEIPYPQTWVFYDFQQALTWFADQQLPLVFKTSAGGSARGVHIIRSRKQGRKLFKQSFAHGIQHPRMGPYERQRGRVYLQEYLPNVKEWRMVRIGDSYFGYRKEKGDGDFHSASHKWSWLDPPRSLLNMLREVTETGGFTSMDVDIFETEDSRLLVNELQTVFGASTPADQLRVNGKAGRYVYHPAGAEDKWVFEEGDFSRNACANLRVEYLLDQILSISRPIRTMEAYGANR